MYQDPHEPEFNVQGNLDVLEKMVINIETLSNDPRYPGYPVSKTQTQLYKGRQQAFKNDVVVSYAIYFSYENKVGKMNFDNIMWRSDGHINQIHVFKDDDKVYIKYYGLESDLKKDDSPASKAAIPLEDYFKENRITDKEEQEEYRKKFFDFFEPDKQEYQLLPLDKQTADHYLSLSLEDKKKYNLPADYIKQMNLPDDELKELLKNQPTK